MVAAPAVAAAPLSSFRRDTDVRRWPGKCFRCSSTASSSATTDFRWPRRSPRRTRIMWAHSLQAVAAETAPAAVGPEAPPRWPSTRRSGPSSRRVAGDRGAVVDPRPGGSAPGRQADQVPRATVARRRHSGRLQISLHFVAVKNGADGQRDAGQRGLGAGAAPCRERGFPARCAPAGEWWEVQQVQTIASPVRADPIRFEVIRNAPGRGDRGDGGRPAAQRLLDQHQDARRLLVRLLRPRAAAGRPGVHPADPPRLARRARADAPCAPTGRSASAPATRS